VASVLAINLSGFDEFNERLRNLDKVLLKEADFAVKDSAKLWEQRAKQDVPVDQGRLKAGISVVKNGVADYYVTSNAEYSPYIEWGTKKYVNVPADLAAYASQFKGRKGGAGIDQFFLMILDWVRRKGITGTYSVKTKRRTGNKRSQTLEDYDTAFAIFISILKNGIHPRPFFFIQRPLAEAQLMKDLKQILTSL
jgi:HK97 gp10 family phage protein